MQSCEHHSPLTQSYLTGALLWEGRGPRATGLVPVAKVQALNAVTLAMMVNVCGDCVCCELLGGHEGDPMGPAGCDRILTLSSRRPFLPDRFRPFGPPGAF